MTGLTQNYAELNEANKPFIFYPFRIRQFLDSSLPFGVCASWSSRYQESDGRILLILKIDGHWIFLTGIPVEQNGLLWTLWTSIGSSCSACLLSGTPVMRCFATGI